MKRALARVSVKLASFMLRKLKPEFSDVCTLSQRARDPQRHFITLLKVVGCSGGSTIACVLMSKGIKAAGKPGRAQTAENHTSLTENHCFYHRQAFYR